MSKTIVFMLAGLLSAAAAQADIRAITEDGRRVMLHEQDHTWVFQETGQSTEAKSAVLQVINKKELTPGCRIGLKLTNNLGYRIQSLVPRFTAYTRGQVPYDTVSRAFSELKPTSSQYQEIQFPGIDCGNILYVTVHGADRCQMGPYTKFSPSTGECLQQIFVKESDLVKILREDPPNPELEPALLPPGSDQPPPLLPADPLDIPESTPGG